MSSNVIPIFHCFDENYVLPAAVSFDSMLRNANKNYKYELFVAGRILKKSQDRLREIIKGYSNARIDFISEYYDFEKIFQSTNSAHFSSELFLKFLVPNLLPNYERAIVTDVDVVWLGDISLIWSKAGSLKSDYLAAVRPINSPDSNFYNDVRSWYKNDFSPEEIDYLDTGAGLWVFNLDLMRKNNIPQKAIEFAINNANRLIQPEQDVMNIIVANKKLLLPPRMMVCNYLYDIYPNLESAKRDLINSKDEMIDAYLRPIQLHYPGPRKPWTHPNVTASHYWFKSLSDTTFLNDWLVENQKRLDASSSVRSALKLIAHKALITLLVPIKRFIPSNLKRYFRKLFYTHFNKKI